MEELYARLEPYIWPVAKALVIFIVGWIFSKWANKITRKLIHRFDPTLTGFLAGIAQYTVLAMAVIASLAAVGVQTTSLVAVFASAGLAVGLALQGSLGNFAGGVMILIFRPFQLGHRVTAGGHFGDIEDIGIFATTMVTLQNETIIIPNSAITGDAIINYTQKGKLRYSVEVGVAYGNDIAKTSEVLLAGVKKAEHVLEDPEPGVAFVGLGASSLDFLVHVWSTPENYIDLQTTARKACYDALNEAGIEIPFSQLVVHKAE
ncbi:MAG: mechanosensitive ion channel [Acidobacteriota bacterium]|nr:mechanosensitive ion channel [Acidobacteriota bacterium]